MANTDGDTRNLDGYGGMSRMLAFPFQNGDTRNLDGYGGQPRLFAVPRTDADERLLLPYRTNVFTGVPTPRGDLWRTFVAGVPVFSRHLPVAGSFPVLMPNCEEDPVKTYSVNTTDATPTLLWAYTIPTDATVNISIDLSAQVIGGPGSGVYSLKTGANNVGLGAVLFGSTIVVNEQESNPAWDAYFQVSGNNVQLMVQGVALTNINWTAAVLSVSAQ